MDIFFSQFPYKCHLFEAASVGDWLEICLDLDSRVAFLQEVREPRNLPTGGAIFVLLSLVTALQEVSADMHC